MFIGRLRFNLLFKIAVGALPLTLVSFALPLFAEPLPQIIEGMPPTFRKVNLTGRHFPGPMPQNFTVSDSEPEETFVDTMTLQLQNRTTEVYIPVGSSDLAVTVNRNVEDSTWVQGETLSPAQRPDLPFGNCWSSGLAANVHLVDRGKDVPRESVVTDEEGTSHRFVVSVDAEGKANFIPLPNARSQQDFAHLTLRWKEDEEGFVFTRKYGTRLVFKKTPSVEFNIQPGEKDPVRHAYHRLDRIEDRFGATILYRYHKSNAGIIPDQIVFGSQVVTFYRGDNGCIERLYDPAGNCRIYNYREPKQPGGAPLLVGFSQTDRRLIPRLHAL